MPSPTVSVPAIKDRKLTLWLTKTLVHLSYKLKAKILTSNIGPEREKATPQTSVIQVQKKKIFL